MVNQNEAEALAKDAIQKYMTACGLETTEDAGNALMKLCSVAGVMLVATVGYENAVARLEGTTSFIAKSMRGIQSRQELPN